MSPASSKRRGAFGRRDRKTTIRLLADDKEVATSSDALAAAGLPTDTVALDEGQADRLKEAEPIAARERALRLLGYRERSFSELEARLLEDGYPHPVVGTVLHRLVDIGLVDDSRFTSEFIRSKAGAGWGRARVLRSLREHAIDADLTQEALDELLPEEDEVDRALLVVRSISISTHKDREKALRRLVSKGFTYPQAVEAVSRLQAGQAEES